MTENPYIECGKVINTHGCFGGLKLESWCNTPKDLTELRRLYLKKGSDYVEYKVTKASVFKQFVILTLDTVDTMDLALALKGQTVYAKRKDFHLEKGEYFLADLIGLSVVEGTGYPLHPLRNAFRNDQSRSVGYLRCKNRKRRKNDSCRCGICRSCRC